MIEQSSDGRINEDRQREYDVQVGMGILHGLKEEVGSRSVTIQDLISRIHTLIAHTQFLAARLEYRVDYRPGQEFEGMAVVIESENPPAQHNVWIEQRENQWVIAFT